MFSSSFLKDLLAPSLGVKILCSATNRAQIVDASAIRIVVKECEWQQCQRRPVSFIPPADRKRSMIAMLRKQQQSSSFQFVPGQLLQGSCTSSNDNYSNKRRKLCSYSSWLQGKHNSAKSPNTTVASLSSLASVASLFPTTEIIDIDEIEDGEGTNDEAVPTDGPSVLKGDNLKIDSFYPIDNQNRYRFDDNKNKNNSNNNNDDAGGVERRKSAPTTTIEPQNCTSSSRPWSSSGIAAHQSDARHTERNNTVSEEPPVNIKRETVETTAATPPWEYMYERLLLHMKERGVDTVIPTRIHRNCRDLELANWVTQQNLDISKGNLDGERQFHLQSIGFGQRLTS